VNPTISIEEVQSLAGPTLDRANAIWSALLDACNPNAPSTLTFELFTTVNLLDEEHWRGTVKPATLQAVNTACERGLIWLQAHAPQSITIPILEVE
jgi:hypothetical protein